DFAGGSTRATTASIAGTTDPALYQDERWGVFTYAIPIQNGTYDVRFRAAETFFATPCVGKRIFSVDIAETTASPDISNLDVCAKVGANAAYVQTITNVSVTDGILDVRTIRAAADDPVLSAIDVIKTGTIGSGTNGDTTGQPPPTVTAKTPADGATGVGTG